MTFWLSFADGNRLRGSQFLGVCIVESPSFPEAIRLCHRLSINPGGEVRGGPFPAQVNVPTEYKNKLLSRIEAEQAEAAMFVGDA